MVPVAPALLSMMKLPPNFSCNLGARVRAIRSVEPPGGKGTRSVTGLSGHAYTVPAHQAIKKNKQNRITMDASKSRVCTLSIRIERIERMAAGHEQTVILCATKA